MISLTKWKLETIAVNELASGDTGKSDNCPELCTLAAASYKIRNPHKTRILIAAASLEVQASMEIRPDSTLREQSCDQIVTELGPPKRDTRILNDIFLLELSGQKHVTQIMPRKPNAGSAYTLSDCNWLYVGFWVISRIPTCSTKVKRWEV